MRYSNTVSTRFAATVFVLCILGVAAAPEGFDFADLVSAVLATRELGEADRPRVETFLFKMDQAEREKLRRLPSMVLAIAQARVDRLKALPDMGDAAAGVDPLAGL